MRGLWYPEPTIRKAFIALCAILALAACAPHATSLHGMQLDPPRPAPDFTLTDQNGGSFKLTRTRGQAVALYFGFTHCKDTCPQTLALLGKARSNAGLRPSQARIVMITIDPQRDSPQALREFFKRIGVQATGLTGSRASLEAVYKAYGVGVQPQKNDILHTDMIYIIDPSGRIRETLAPQSPLKDVAADLRAVVE